MLPTTTAANQESRIRRADVVKLVVLCAVLVVFAGTTFWPPPTSDDVFRSRTVKHWTSILKQSKCAKLIAQKNACLDEGYSKLNESECNEAQRGAAWCSDAFSNGNFYS